MSLLSRYLPLVAMVTALGAAIMAGLLFAFSNFVMRALSELPAAYGLEAMQRINVDIVNPLFLSLFLGTPALCLVVTIVALQGGAGGVRTILLAGAACYLVGVVGVTMGFNVPLNNALASLGAAAAPVDWPAYVGRWLRWNHVRTVAAFVSAVLLLIGAYADTVTRHP
jgi:uncharacterized membrane protein